MSANPNATALLRQGIDEYNAGRRDHAEALIRQAVTLDPSAEQGWLWLAAVVRDLGETENALQNALAINPANLDTAAHLATVRGKLAAEQGERFKAPTGERPAIHPSLTAQPISFDTSTSTMPVNPAPSPNVPTAVHSYIPLSAPMTAANAAPAAAPIPIAAPSAIAIPAPAAPSYTVVAPPTAPAATPSTAVYVNNNYYAPPPPPLLLVPAGPPFIVRAIYFVFIGWWLTYLWVIFAWVLNLTIIGLPIGLTMLNLVPQVLTLEPVRRNYIAEYTASGRLIARAVDIPQLALLPRAIYFALIGWWASLAWMMVAATLCLTILGLPLGIWMFHRSPTITTLRRL